MNKIVMKGSAAELRWGYHRAAELGAWTVEGGVLSGRLLSHDRFSLSQRPLTFVITRAKGAPWVYGMDGLTIIDGHITATLHAQET